MTEVDTELDRIAAAAVAHEGIVVAVQGLGFVGTAVCAALGATGRHVVIGVDLADEASARKVAAVADGRAPFAAPDPELADALARGVAEGRLFASTRVEAYGLADVIVIDVDLGVGPDGEIAIGRLEDAVRAIGRVMREDALVVVETTVPVGTCANVVLPALVEERSRRGIDAPPALANAYERVMPGPRYVASVRSYPRSYAGLDERSADRAQAFLESFVEAPVSRLPDLASAELGKLLENSYRAANIAFIHEWTRLAESIGVNLWAVAESIRARRGTHDNIRNPGFGVGGYCLPKDALLAQWGAERLLGSDVRLETTLAALETNALMPLHTLDVLRELAGGRLAGLRVAICGIAYLADVPDTRNSPSDTMLRALMESHAEVVVHDPVVDHWAERPDVELAVDLDTVLARAEAVVLAVAHRCYRELSAERLLRSGPKLLVDTQNIVDDATARRLHEAGWRVAGVGKGHWRAAGYGDA